MELRLHGNRPEDRLATAVFVAALLHGLVILGLRFTAPASDDRPLPTLEVLLVPDGPADEANPEASYIASRDQRGSGTTRERLRTSLPEASARLLEHSGETGGEAFTPQASTTAVGGSRLLTTSTAARPPGAGRRGGRALRARRGTDRVAPACPRWG